jgi:hypothetical protein
LRSGSIWLEESIDEDVIFVDRYFEASGSYGVNFRLIANDGYVFADDMQVIVNGIMISPEAASPGVKTLDIDYFFNMTCQHIEGNTATCEKKAVCAVCGQEYGELLAHTYENGKCTVCGAADPSCSPEADSQHPNGSSEIILWIVLSVIIVGGAVTALVMIMVKRKRKQISKQ